MTRKERRSNDQLKGLVRRIIDAFQLLYGSYFQDTAWENKTKLTFALARNVNLELESTKYCQGIDGKPYNKTWYYKGRWQETAHQVPTVVNMVIKASFCGSQADPMDTYDLNAYVTD